MSFDSMRDRLDEIIHNPDLLRNARLKTAAFTRKRSMGFCDALCFLLDMSKTTLQTRLNRFYSLKKGGIPISQPAFTQLRAQFDHSPFEYIVRDFVKTEYSGAHQLPKWNNCHVLAVDGSYLQLPTDPSLAKEFGVRGAGNRPSAGISVLYDVLNGWVLGPEIAHTDRNERVSCAKHIDFLVSEL